ncbi:MAG: hypothetical protein K8R60_14575 [Burkholderiales bacterium]|nr:hypothetical protein [Burkholderiales bacterium]
MLRVEFPARRAPAFALSLLAAALLAACGGGGSDRSVGLDDATATMYAANAAQIGSDAAGVADAGVQAAQAMIAAGAGAMASDDRMAAQAAGAQPLATSSKPCPGGGTATVSITGGTGGSESNGKLDTGEVYQVSYAACTGAAGLGQLDGTLAMTVLNASGDSANGALSLTTTATGLMLTTPRGTATLNGSIQRDYSVATDSDGTVHLGSHFVTTPSVTLATNYNARSSLFTLSATDIQRTATLVGGVLQSSTIMGTHTLAGVLPNATFSFTVATTGGATTYGPDGRPTSGAWTVTLPSNIVTVTIANAMATITIDHGKDGTIDRTITIPLPQLEGNVG